MTKLPLRISSQGAGASDTTDVMETTLINELTPASRAPRVPLCGRAVQEYAYCKRDDFL